MKEKKEMRWKLADIGATLKDSFNAMLRGEFLMTLNVGRFFVHIAYTFLLFVAIIWISLAIENTMAQVESNKKVIKELEIVHSQKTFEVVSLSRRSTVDGMLQEMGSKVSEPTKPATVLK